MTVLEELNNHLNRPDAGQCRKFAVDAVKIILKRFRKGMDLKENGGVFELKSTKRRRKRDVNGAGVQPPPQPRSDSVMSRRLRYQARHGTPVLGLSSPRGRRPRCGNEDEPTRPVYRAEGSELDYHDDEFENLSVSNELQHDGDGDGLSVSSELRHDGGPRRVLPSSILGGASRVQRRRPTRGSQLPRVSHLSPSPSRPISPETTNDIPRASLNSPEPPPASTSGPFSNFEASVRLASFLTYIEGFLSANPADYKELLAQLAQGLSRLNLNKSDFMTKIRSIRTVEGNMKILVTGGAGFIGSHLVERLMQTEKNEVIVVDNYSTGSKDNLKEWIGHPRFELIQHDVTEPLFVEVDQIYHLAFPASPIYYKDNPVKTIKTNVMGTLNMLGLAKRVGARILLASTSEVYGDPIEHPQTESYFGNVNPIGVRSCYVEGKRVAETLMFDYHGQHEIEIRIARIFNTYGPRMNINDGHVVSNFIAQAIRDQPLTVQLPGTQTRSFCYVADMVDGLIRLMQGEHTGPINIGNPVEITMLELAEIVKEIINPKVEIITVENTPDDPCRKKPDITKAKQLLGWEPKIKLRDGVPFTEEDFRQRLSVPQKVVVSGELI